MPTKSACRTLLLALSTTWLLGCNGPTLESDVKEGNSRLEAGDLKQALIHAKSALQQQPNSPDARLLLARTLLESEEAAAAATEFKKLDKDFLARDEAATILLARSLLESGQYKELTEKYGATRLNKPELAAQFLAYVAAGHLANGNPGSAKSTIEQAAALAKNSELVLLTRSDIEYAAGNIADVKALLEKVVAANANNAQAWLRMGAVKARDAGDIDGAIDAFRRAIKIKADFHTARSNLIFMLLAKGNVKAAAEEISLFKKALPLHPQTTYFEAQLALSNKNYKDALELIQKVLRVRPENVLALGLAGEIQTAVGQLRQAEQSLSKGLNLAPESASIRQALAQVYLQTNRADAALNVLKPLLDPNRSTTSRAQFLAGEAHLARGNINDSIANLEVAAKLDPKNTLARVQLILTRGKGKIEPRGTVKALKELADSDKGVIADLTLVNLSLQLKDYAGALGAVDTLAKKTPKSALPFNLRGTIQFQRKDYAAARQALEQALALEPKSMATISALADVDVAQRKPDAAKNRLREVLKSEPKNYQALFGLVKLTDAKTQGEEYLQLLRSAIDAKPDAADPRVLMVRYHLERNEIKAAASAAQAAAAALPENPDVLDWLGKTQIASSDLNQAISTYNRLVSLQSQSPYAYLRLAGALLAANDNATAKRNLGKALLVDPKFFPAQEALVKLAVAEKRRDEAMAIAKTMQKQQPKDPAGYLLEGDIEAQFGKLPAAVDIYRTTLKGFPSPLIAVKLYSAMLGARQEAEAEKLVTTWSAEHTKDTVLVAFAGDAMISRQSYALAEKYFRQVLAIDANNVAALNNVAWLLLKQQKPGATEIVERAIKIQPDSPAVLDTLAQALAHDKAFARAISSQRRAVELSPRDMGLKLNLAKIYVAAGEKSSAKQELTALKALGDRFPAHAEVTQLLGSL